MKKRKIIPVLLVICVVFGIFSPVRYKELNRFRHGASAVFPIPGYYLCLQCVLPVSYDAIADSVSIYPATGTQDQQDNSRILCLAEGTFKRFIAVYRIDTDGTWDPTHVVMYLSIFYLLIVLAACAAIAGGIIFVHRRIRRKRIPTA